MDAQIRKILHDMIDMQKEGYNCPVSESTLFGRLMCQYTDSSSFYLEAAGEALEDWNHHAAAAVCRRMAGQSLNPAAALAAEELLYVAEDILKMHDDGMVKAREQDTETVDSAVQKLRQIIDNARGRNKDWRFWDNDMTARMKRANH